MAVTRTTYSRLHNTLAASKTQKDNNALFQTINNLITSLQSVQTTFNDSVLAIQASINSFRFVQVVEIDTSSIAPTLDLTQYVFGNFLIFKDISGNASVNNITLTGIVDGVTDPVINTNYGSFRVFIGLDGNFHEW